MTDSYKETHESWNKVAEAYESIFMHLDIYNSSYDDLCSFLPAHSAVLEVGCGPGNIANYLINKRPDLHFLGTDVSDEMLKLARLNVPQTEFLNMDVRNLDQLDKKFDALIAGFCIPIFPLMILKNSWGARLPY